MKRVITATVMSALFAAPAMGQTPQAPAAATQKPAAPAAATPAPAPQAPAVAVPFPADARIGFVNMQAIVSSSTLGKAGQEKMKALTDKKSAEISAKNKEIQTLQQEIQSGQSVLSASVLAQKNGDFDRKTREVQFLQEQAQVDVDALQQQLLDEFSAKVLPIVEQIRSERNLWVVLALGDGTGIAAVHAGLDLSAEVVKRLDSAK